MLAADVAGGMRTAVLVTCLHVMFPCRPGEVRVSATSTSWPASACFGPGSGAQGSMPQRSTHLVDVVGLIAAGAAGGSGIGALHARCGTALLA